MRKPLSYFTAGVMFLLLMLTLSTPVAERKVQADPKTLQEKCDECNIRNSQQLDQCVAVHGIDELRCFDQFNEGVVICFRNFCEQ